MASNQTCREQYGMGDWLDGVSNYSNQQIAYYCPLFAEYDKFENSLYFAMGLIMAITGVVGLVSNIFTYVTFSNGSAFVGPSFLYHKAMALMEILHMIIMLQYGVLRAMNFPGGNSTYWMVWWRDYNRGGWIIGNTAKMAVSCLIMFVSLERMIAMWFPFKFDKINKQGVAIAAIVLSILVGFLNLPVYASGFVAVEPTGYFLEPTKFDTSAAYAAIQNAITAIKLWSGGVTLALCVLVALGMYRASRNALQMSSDAKVRWQAMKMGCYLQLILGVTTVVTHVAYVWFQMVMQQPYPHVGAYALIMVESFDQLLANISLARYLRAVEMVHAVFTCLDHGGRFFFYLAFHATFRATFKEHVWDRVNKTPIISLVSNR